MSQLTCDASLQPPKGGGGSRRPTQYRLRYRRLQYRRQYGKLLQYRRRQYRDLPSPPLWSHQIQA